MTMPMSPISATKRRFADLIKPVNGLVQVIPQYNEVLAKLREGDEPNYYDNYVFGMLPPGERLGEELTVVFEGATTGNNPYAGIYIGIAGKVNPDPISTPADRRYKFYDATALSGFQRLDWLSFDFTQGLDYAAVFLKWVPENGWIVTGRTPNVGLSDEANLPPETA